MADLYADIGIYYDLNGLPYPVAVDKELIIMYNIYDYAALTTFNTDLEMPYNIAPGPTIIIPIEILYDIGTVGPYDKDLIFTPLPGNDSHPVSTSTDSITATLIPSYVAAGAETAALPITPSPGNGASTGGVWGCYVSDYYDTIYVIPETMSVGNVRIDDTVDLYVWNASFASSMKLITTTETPVINGLSDSMTAGTTTWAPMEYKKVTITIGDSAALYENVLFEWDIQNLTTSRMHYATFEIDVTRAQVYENIPELPIEETMEWLTDVITSHDGTEQRIALRETPRRTISYRVLVGDDAEHREKYKKMYSQAGVKTIVPYFQYHTWLAADAVIGATRIYFDPSKTDVRDESYVTIVSGFDGSLSTHGVKAMYSDGCDIYDPLVRDHYSGDIITCAFESIQDASRLDMASVAGYQTITARATLGSAGTAAVDLGLINPYGTPASGYRVHGLLVLNEEPLAKSGASEIFVRGASVMDNETSQLDIIAEHDKAQIGGERTFVVDRTGASGRLHTMDWWRGFLTDLHGMRDPFLMPTYRNDLILTSTTDGSNIIQVSENDMVLTASHFYVAIKNLSTGTTFYRQIIGIAMSFGWTYYSVTLDGPVDAGLTADTAKISYMQKVRLASDTVSWTHYPKDSYVRLQIRTINK